MGGYPYNSYLEQSLHYFASYLPVRNGYLIPKEPEQTYLLGSRYADYGLALVFALVIPLLRTILTYVIYKPVGQALLSRQLKKTDAPMTDEKLRKWTESSWKMTVYIVFSVLAYLVSYREPWFTDPTYYWLGCTQFPPCNLHVSQGVLLFYCVQTGFYLQAIHYLAFIEVRRKDFLESMLHHVVTVGLLVYSYYVNFTRVGIMIMLVHDISDIFLEASKLCRYVRQQGIATFFFLLFFVSWVLLRVLYFPLVIIRSTLVDPIELIAKPYNIDPEWHHAAFNILLMILFVLHLYWSYLILVILVGAIRGEARDIREKDDE